MKGEREKRGKRKERKEKREEREERGKRRERKEKREEREERGKERGSVKAFSRLPLLEERPGSSVHYGKPAVPTELGSLQGLHPPHPLHCWAHPPTPLHCWAPPSLVPRLLCGGGGKRAWYTLFAHAPSSLGNLHTTPLY